jgi:hypothetical protein
MRRKCQAKREVFCWRCPRAVLVTDTLTKSVNPVHDRIRHRHSQRAQRHRHPLEAPPRPLVRRQHHDLDQIIGQPPRPRARCTPRTIQRLAIPRRRWPWQMPQDRRPPQKPGSRRGWRCHRDGNLCANLRGQIGPTVFLISDSPPSVRRSPDPDRQTPHAGHRPVAPAGSAPPFPNPTPTCPHQPIHPANASRTSATRQPSAPTIPTCPLCAAGRERSELTDQGLLGMGQV